MTLQLEFQSHSRYADHSTESPNQNQLATLLFGLSLPNSADFEARIRNASASVVSDYGFNKDKTLATLMSCISELADKTCLFGYVVALVNAEHPEVGASIVKGANEALQRYLNEGAWRKAKLTLRFFGELAIYKTISASDLMSLYQTLLSVVDENGSKEERSDTFVDILISCLPYTGKFLKEVDSSDLQNLMQKIDDYIQDGRESRTNVAIINSVFKGSCPYKQVEALELKWIQVRNCEEAKWECTAVSRPANGDIDVVLAGGIAVQLDSIVLPPFNPNLSYYLPYGHFEVFHPSIITQKGKTTIILPPTESVDRFILYDILDDLIYFFSHTHVQLINYLMDGLSVSLDLTTVYSLQQALVEVLVGKIFALPRAEFKEVYYVRVLMDLCRKAPTVIPGIFGKSVNTLADRVHEMDEECQSRFSSWFSLHLSNFGYKWNWADWSDDFQEAKKNSKALFIQETLQKLVKLSYYDRLVEAFPEAIKPLTLTPVFPGQPEYFYSFAANAGAPDVHVDLANRMVECIRLKTPYNDMLAFIDEIKEVGGEALARDILLQTTLFLGSKSFSFLLNMLERNLKVLQVLASTPEAKLHCIRITYAFWVANKQLLAITLDKMVNYKIIDAHSVVSWIFEDMKPDFTRVYVWEILKLTVSKISGRIVAWKEKVKAAESSSMEVEGGASASSARETLENLQRDQKQLFINIFQSFLKAYKENAGKETELWKAWCIGMFTEVAREFHWELKNLITTLDMIVFSDIDDSVASLMDIWNKVKLMHK